MDWYFIDLSLGKGDPGLVFEGGDPHQGRSVGFYTAIKMDEFKDIRELVSSMILMSAE
jgi:hypothetical protein